MCSSKTTMGKQLDVNWATIKTKRLTERTAVVWNWHQKFWTQTPKYNWNKVLSSRLTWTAQWQQSKVRFTLAKSKIFGKTLPVANSHQKCVSGFRTVRTFIVQMFSSPATSYKTAKRSLQTPKRFKKYLCPWKRHQKRWLWHPLSTVHLMYKTVRARKQNFAQQNETST